MMLEKLMDIKLTWQKRFKTMDLEHDEIYMEALRQEFEKNYPWVNIQPSGVWIDLRNLHIIQEDRGLDIAHGQDMIADLNLVPEFIQIKTKYVDGQPYAIAQYTDITGYTKTPFLKEMIPLTEHIDQVMEQLVTMDSYVNLKCGPEMMFDAAPMWIELLLYTLAFMQMEWVLSLNEHYDWVVYPPDKSQKITFVNIKGTKSYIIHMPDGSRTTYNPKSFRNYMMKVWKNYVEDPKTLSEKL